MRRPLLLLSITLATIGLAAWFLLPDATVARNRDIDEGVYLLVARLIHQGHDAHTFFFDQFWLFPKILAAAFTSFGDSLIVGRLIVFAFSLACSIAIGVLSWQLGARWPAVIAAILICAINPLYIRTSRMVMADVPATACIVWALVFVFAFQRNRQWIWLALSGVCAGLALTLKPFAVGFVVTIMFILVVQRMPRENGRLKLDWVILFDLSIFSLAAILVAAPFVDFLHPIDEYRRTVGFHFAEQHWLIKRVDDRWRGLFGFIRLSAPLVVFAISGIAALRPLSVSMLALLTGALLTTIILLQMPPWLHHYVLILPPLVVFAVLGFNRGFAEFKHLTAELRRGQRPEFAKTWIAIFFACALFLSIIDLPWVVRFDRRARWPQPLQTDEVVQYVGQNFRPNEYLLSDDALVLYLAGRLMPPSGINFTFADILKFDPAIFPRFEQIVRENKVAGVIASERYPRNPRLMSWIKTNFPVSADVGFDRPDELRAQIYSAKRETP
jgi:4-amino-4-deoxy-L-arabinose transferase-like glycosyltransferase